MGHHVTTSIDERPPRFDRAPVTLVVPMRDEEQTLATLLATIDDQTLLLDQVVLVDGGSSDRTFEIASRHAQENPRYVVVQTDGPATPGEAET